MELQFKNTSLNQFSYKAKLILNEIQKVVIGKNNTIEMVLTAILAKGHVLIEDIPGVGKTTLALAFSKAMSLHHQRLQFTPDVLPTDVTGFSIYNKQSHEFEYKPGAALCNLFLADEINRTSSKTQSALLEVMEEGRVTVDGITREVPKPYIVIATQNPIGSVGTQMLPESQLDRFMVRITMGYPDLQSEIDILKGRQNRNPLDSVCQVADAEDILAMQRMTEMTHISDPIYDYIVRLVVASRQHPLINLGISPRGAIALTNMAKAAAFIKDRNYVIPDDVQSVFSDVVEHRILMNPKARVNDVTAKQVLMKIQSTVPVPEI